MYLIPAHITTSFIFSAIVMYLPVLVRNLGYSAALVGIILAVAEGAGIAGPFLISRFTDKFGKYKRSIIFSATLTALPALPLALFGYPVFSAIFVAIIAIGYRSTTSLIEAITSISVGKSGNYGKIRVFSSIAFVAFALFLQWVPVLKPDSAINIAFWIIITSVLAVSVISFLPFQATTAQPALTKTPTDNSLEHSPNDINKKSIWTPFFILGLVCIALNRLAMAPIYSFLSLFLLEDLRWNVVGLMWALQAAAEIPFIYISHRIIRRFGPMPVLAFSSVMVALRLALYAFSPFRGGLIFAQLLHSFCFGLFHPAAVSFVSGCVPTEKRSYGMTLYLSLGNGLPLLIGNFVGGFIVQHAGYRPLFGSFMIFPVLSVLIYFAGRSKKVFT